MQFIRMITQVVLLAALVEIVQLRPVTLEDSTKPTERTILSISKRQTTGESFLPIAQLLNTIAGIQDSLPPIRVKAASFPVDTVTPVVAVESSLNPTEVVQPTTPAAVTVASPVDSTVTIAPFQTIQPVAVTVASPVDSTVTIAPFQTIEALATQPTVPLAAPVQATTPTTPVVAPIPLLG